MTAGSYGAEAEVRTLAPRPRRRPDESECAMTQLDPKIREKIYDLGLKVAKVPKAPFRALLELWADDRRDQSDPREEPVTCRMTSDCSDDNPFGLVPLDPPWLDPFEIAARLAALHAWGVKSMGFEPVATHDWYQSLELELMDAYIGLRDEVPNLNEHDIRFLEQCLVCLEEITAHVQAAVETKDTKPLTRLERAVFDLVEQQVPEGDTKEARRDKPVLTIDIAAKIARFNGRECRFESNAQWRRFEKLARRPGFATRESASAIWALKKTLESPGLGTVAKAISCESSNRYTLRTADFSVSLVDPPKPSEN